MLTPSPKNSRWAADTYAAIDLGSNSFRLEVARLRAGDYKTLAYWKEPVRLGAGLDAEGRLTEAAMTRALDCLRRFGRELQGFPAERLRAVATQTLREAANRDAFLLRAQEALGHPVEVIAGREEARLIYSGVSHLQPAAHTRLVIDIGGRSTELILGQGNQPLAVESFRIGSVGLSVRYFAEGRLTAEAFRAAQIAAAAELEEALALFGRRHCQPAWLEVLGSSGTAGAVSQILEDSGHSDGRITPDGLRWCIDACIQAGSVAALRLPGLKDDRRGVVAGGLCILYTLMSLFEIDEILPAKGALRQGLVVELDERLRARRPADDPREPTVLELQQRFAVDREQAQRVRALGQRLHRQLDAEAAPERQLEMGWAAALHEIGMLVSHHDHHRHAQYLLAHLDAPGFSQNQLRRLSQIALGQRGGLRKLEAELRDDSLIWQVLALRLAVIKCHARGPIQEQHIQLRRQGRQVRVQMARGWGVQHPQALYLLTEEAQAWAKTGLLELDIRA
ncbi:exopolyphosphatase [Inhella sp.]|uniref:Ppx/GppA phosphatase family protein n=1 Tax=Inhella sp. TaxID=1921806 RepID=UPI0035B4D872